jgi:hypothetical protein
MVQGIRLLKQLYGAAIIQRINEASSDEEIAQIAQIQAEALTKHIDADYKKMNKSEIAELERLHEEDQLRYP